MNVWCTFRSKFLVSKQQEHATNLNSLYYSVGPNVNNLWSGTGKIRAKAKMFLHSYEKITTVNSTIENHRQWRTTRKDIAEFLEK